MHSSEIGEQMCGNSLGVWRRAVSTLDPLLPSPPYLLGWRGPREGVVVRAPSLARTGPVTQVVRSPSLLAARKLSR